jgi:hypothetical protein
MNVDPSGQPRRWSGRIRRLAAPVPIGVAGVAPLVVGLCMTGAGAVRVGRIVVLVLSLSLLFAAGVQAVRRRVGRRPELPLEPTNPPIEQIAADLRRMLWRHDMLARSNDIAMPARRLQALEAAISRSALQAARALGVSHPEPPGYGGFDTWQLRRLLRGLAAKGLMLPPDVGLLAPDRF